MRSVAPDLFSSLPNTHTSPDPTMGPPEYLAGRPMSREAAAELAKAERAVTGGRIERKGFAAQAQAAANEWAVGEDPVKEAPRGRRPAGIHGDEEHVPPEYIAGRPVTREAAEHIAAAEAKQTGGNIQEGGFAHRAMVAAERNAGSAE